MQLPLAVIVIIVLVHPPASASDKFVQIKNSTFVLNDEEYRALGVCLYPAHAANFEYIRRVIIEAKSNGFTLVRIVDIFESEYGKSDNSLTSDRVWKHVDWIIKISRDFKMKVLLDLSTVRQFLYYSPTRRDSYDPNIIPLWNSIVDFVTGRQNSFTGIVYRDDPTIMSYAIAGEPVPYGGNLNDWSNGFHSSRSPYDIEQNLFYVSDRLREKDSNHLISAGGLLHLVDQSHYHRVWSYKNIDYSSIHIYPNEQTDPIGEWQNLNKYKQFSDSISKPLMLEEFGSQNALTRNNYINQSFEYCFQNKINIVILWNWAPGGSFDVFSHMTHLMNIIHQQARRWGFDGEFLKLNQITYVGQRSVIDIADFRPMTGDPGYGGQLVISDDNITVPISFNEQYNWYWIFMDIEKSVHVTAEYLAADIFLPIDSPSPLFIKFHVNNIQQDDSALRNNWLIPGMWNTVYISLNSNHQTSPNGSDLKENITSIESLGIIILNMNTIYSGNIYIRDLRLGTLENNAC